MKSAIGPLRRKRRETLRLPGLPIKALSSKSRKLSIAQKSLVLDLLVQGRRPYEIRDLLREEQGVAITSAAVAAYMRGNRDEIIKRKRLLNDGMDLVHLRHRHARLQEHVRLHAILVRQLFKEMCETCGGQGCVSIKTKVKRCKTCRGLKYVVPDSAKAYGLGDDYGLTALTLSNSISAPQGCDLAVFDRLMTNLKEIGDLVGDAKLRISVDPEEHERVAKAKLQEAYAAQMAQMSPAEFTKLLMQLADEKERTIIDVSEIQGEH